VTFVPKEANPSNCPELRSIERYWALVKKHLKTTKGSAQNKNDFGKKWSSSTKKVDEDTVKTIMEGIPEKVKIFINKN